MLAIMLEEKRRFAVECELVWARVLLFGARAPVNA